MKIIYLGGWFTDDQRIEIIDNSKGGIQFAADCLQQSILKGLLLNNIDVTCVNLPYIGTYPHTYNKALIKTRNITSNQTKGINQGFVNVVGFKRLSRMISSLTGLLGCLKKNKVKDDFIILIYAIHSPFLLSATLIKLFRPKIRICVYVPDLPEFMGSYGFFKRMFRMFDSHIVRFSLKYADSFVLLTDSMISKLSIEKKKTCVIEGIFDDEINKYNTNIIREEQKKIILYTGTLSSRYGILTLLEAFHLIEDENYELQICGEGNSKEIIQSVAQKDRRVKYFGQLDRNEIISLQQKATLLVNPRSPEGEFTKYSFPSKTMEYMASGTPVLLYKLVGIPDEYFKYCYTLPDNADSNYISNEIIRICSQEKEILKAKGDEARGFILKYKNPKKQIKQLIDIL